jgi:hypothetical protein
MGNNASTKKEPEKFGTVYGTDGKTRPGYYLGNGKVVYKGKELVLLPGESDFQKLRFGYLRSNQRVFYNGVPIPGANPATFSTVTRNNVKTLSKVPEKNEEFEKLNSVLGMDFLGNKKRIYYRMRIIHEE